MAIKNDGLLRPSAVKGFLVNEHIHYIRKKHQKTAPTKHGLLTDFHTMSSVQRGNYSTETNKKPRADEARSFVWVSINPLGICERIYYNRKTAVVRFPVTSVRLEIGVNELEFSYSPHKFIIQQRKHPFLSASVLLQEPFSILSIPPYFAGDINVLSRIPTFFQRYVVFSAFRLALVATYRNLLQLTV